MTTWLVFFVNLAACSGFVAITVLRAKRIGGVAPWLLALVGVVDAGLFILFRLYALLSDPYDYGRSNGLTMYVLGVVVLVAFHSLMPKTRRA